MLDGSSARIAGTLVRQLREEREWSRRELARRAGLAAETIEGIETGRYRGEIASLIAIAEAFGVDPFALVVREPRPAEQPTRTPRETFARR